MSYQQACKTADDSQQRRGVSSNGTPPANNYHQTPYQIFRNSTTINTSAANGVILGSCDDDQEDDICDIESIDLDSQCSDGDDEEDDEDEGKENSIITTVVGKTKKKTQPATTLVALSPNSYKIRERARLLLMQQPGHNKTKRRLLSGDGGTNIKSDSSGGIVGTVKQSVNDGSSTTRELGGYHPQSSLASAAGARASSSKPFSRGAMHNNDPMAMMMGSNYSNTIPKRQSGPAMQQSSSTNQRKKSTLVNNNLVKINMPNGDRRVPLSNVSNKTNNNKAKLKKNKRQPSSYSNNIMINNNNDPIHALQRLHTDLSSNSKPNTIKRSDILAEEIEADLQEIASAFTHVVSEVGSKASKAVSVVNGGFEAVGNGFWQLWDE